jgi:serine/threonine protein kinase
MENLTGKQLGPYRVVAPLGEGGMAAVYKAYQPGMDRYVALKILPQQLAADPQFVGRFKHEAQVLAKLQHPHILPVFDFGEADGYTYIVMPLVESGTLTQLMAAGRLPLTRIRDIIVQVGDALDYAHSQGLIHRDIKPSNVLIDTRGNCLLTDFGIAKMVQGSTRFTSTGGIVGTPDYMSPEQGSGNKVDPRTDIYSLGIMLYELVTGRLPYQAETPIAVVFKHISDPLPLPSLLNPATPEPLERVILKALAKDPNERFATAGDMVRALKAALPDTANWTQTPAPPPASAPAPPPASALAAPPPRPPTPLPPPVSTVPTSQPIPAQPVKKGTPAWLIAAGVLGVLALCAVLIVAVLTLRRFLRQRDNSPTATVVVAGAAGQDSILVTRAGVDPDNQLSSVAAYRAEVSYTLVVDNGIIEVWMDGFTDPDCLSPDASVGINATLYYNNAPAQKGSGTVVVQLVGAATSARYLSANARLSNTDISTHFAQDADHLPCFENTLAVPAPGALNLLNLRLWQ